MAIMPGAEPFYFSGDRTGCLLIHGFTGTPNEMRWLGTQLSTAGHTVLGVRLAGDLKLSPVASEARAEVGGTERRREKETKGQSD